MSLSELHTTAEARFARAKADIHGAIDRFQRGGAQTPCLPQINELIATTSQLLTFLKEAAKQDGKLQELLVSILGAVNEIHTLRGREPITSKTKDADTTELVSLITKSLDILKADLAQPSLTISSTSSSDDSTAVRAEIQRLMLQLQEIGEQNRMLQSDFAQHRIESETTRAARDEMLTQFFSECEQAVIACSEAVHSADSDSKLQSALELMKRFNNRGMKEIVPADFGQARRGATKLVQSVRELLATIDEKITDDRANRLLIDELKVAKNRLEGTVRELQEADRQAGFALTRSQRQLEIANAYVKSQTEAKEAAEAARQLAVGERDQTMLKLRAAEGDIASLRAERIRSNSALGEAAGVAKQLQQLQVLHQQLVVQRDALLVERDTALRSVDSLQGALQVKIQATEQLANELGVSFELVKASCGSGRQILDTFQALRTSPHFHSAALRFITRSDDRAWIESTLDKLLSSRNRDDLAAGHVVGRFLAEALQATGAWQYLFDFKEDQVKNEIISRVVPRYVDAMAFAALTSEHATQSDIQTIMVEKRVSPFLRAMAISRNTQSDPLTVLFAARGNSDTLDTIKDLLDSGIKITAESMGLFVRKNPAAAKPLWDMLEIFDALPAEATEKVILLLEARSHDKTGYDAGLDTYPGAIAKLIRLRNNLRGYKR